MEVKNLSNIIFGTKIVFSMKKLFLYSNNYIFCMKKVAFVLIVAFVTALVVSSCNKEACPAYSKADAPKTSQVG
jgi:hypothetical protein